MYISKLLNGSAFWVTVLILSSTALALPSPHAAVSARSSPNSLDLVRHPSPYTLPRGHVQADHHSSLVARTPYKNAPGLPAGWVATYRITNALLPIQYSARQLEAFYFMVVQAMEQEIEFPDKLRQTIQIGQLALVFITGVKGQKCVTRNMIIATAMMLMEYAKGGFEELFFAKLTNDDIGMSLYIQLKIMDRKE
ncbi:MAG: hypothetical protein LQ350_000130 [Teloschistes chrysophthalmus]|nr:MAG: hypothetical protein LQ350_000130 [Niorma chrysophthalma]